MKKGDLFTETTADKNTTIGHSVEITEVPENNNIISSRFIPCSMGGKHNIVGNGIGYV